MYSWRRRPKSVVRTISGNSEGEHRAAASIILEIEVVRIGSLCEPNFDYAASLITPARKVSGEADRARQ
jgi:hypothetical protein